MKLIMADSIVRQSSPNLLHQFAKVIKSPSVIAYFVLVLTVPFWTKFVMVAALRTFVFDPHEWIVGTMMIGITAFTLWTWIAFFRAIRKPGGARKLFGDLCAMLALLPLISATVVWQNLRDGEFSVKENGKVRPATKSEGLNIVLSRQ